MEFLYRHCHILKGLISPKNPHLSSLPKKRHLATKASPSQKIVSLSKINQDRLITKSNLFLNFEITNKKVARRQVNNRDSIFENELSRSCLTTECTQTIVSIPFNFNYNYWLKFGWVIFSEFENMKILILFSYIQQYRLNHIVEKRKF